MVNSFPSLPIILIDTHLMNNSRSLIIDDRISITCMNFYRSFIQEIFLCILIQVHHAKCVTPECLQYTKNIVTKYIKMIYVYMIYDI